MLFEALNPLDHFINSSSTMVEIVDNDGKYTVFASPYVFFLLSILHIDLEFVTELQ